MTDKGLYKYVYDGEIIYIGMSTSSISQRVKQHSCEEKFKPYLDKTKIFVCSMSNHAEIKGCETLLINKYSPVLNVTDNKSEGCVIDVENQLPQWEPFITKNPTKKAKKKQQKKPYRFEQRLFPEKWKWLESCPESQFRVALDFDLSNRYIDSLLHDFLWRNADLMVDEQFEHLYCGDEVYDFSDFFVWILTSDATYTTRCAFNESKLVPNKTFKVEEYEWEYVHDKLIPFNYLRQKGGD